ncbi:unnamed protein product, partial [Mesorhabditis spiculigera]
MIFLIQLLLLSPGRLAADGDGVDNKIYSGSAPDNASKIAPAHNVIRIGHIGAVNTMPNYEKVLELSRQELLADGTFGDDFDVEVINKNGCGDAFEGVAAAADMYHVDKVMAFLGPYCNSEMVPVATMAAYWNKPIIAYMATSNALADKKIYKTLARVSIRTINTQAEATGAFIRHYKWRKVAFVTNAGAAAYEKIVAFEKVFRRMGVNVVKKIVFDETATAQDMISSGQIDEIKTTSRIVIALFSSVRDLTTEFRKATEASGLSTSEYVFVFPSIQEGANGASPFVGSSNDMLDSVKKNYANCILIDDVNGFDDRLMTPFLERLSAIGLGAEDIDLKNIYGYISLYDSMKIFGLAGRRVLEATKNFSEITNGKRMFDTMRRMTFSGMASVAGSGSGTVLLDDQAERLPFYSAFYVSAERNRVLSICNITPSLMPASKCSKEEDNPGCVDIVSSPLGYKLQPQSPSKDTFQVSDVQSGFWNSVGGQMPIDEPACGFRGEKCDYTLIIVCAAATLALISAVISAFLLKRHCESRALNNMPWRIFRDDMRIVNEDEVKSMLSLGSQRTKLSNMGSSMVKHHAIIGVNTHATYHMYQQNRQIKFGRQDLVLLMRMKQAVHDNLNPFLGMTFNEKNELLLLWKFCSRGTLQDLIYNENFVLDGKFHGAFVRDITLGLEYLHTSNIGFHGSLTTWSTLIDRNWLVKLTDYGINDAISRWEKHGSIELESLKDGEEKSGAWQKMGVLYVAPDIRMQNDKNKKRRMDQKWVEQTFERRRAADIYAFGIVIYEILFRMFPFSNKVDLDEIADKAMLGEKVARPSVHSGAQIHPDLLALLQDCWSDTPEVRPTIRRVRLSTESYLKTKGSLVDSMMRMMEEYANNLEKLVAERTGMLEEANQKADRLLSQLLPKYVAAELKAGRGVPPKSYATATVLFSDVVGFTKMCSSSTPLEVVNMLNSVYSGFDAVINKHEAYKVETIGDAYMVVSGVPEENGKRHIAHIADISLEIMKFLADYEVPHRKGQRLRCRLGFHTGSVAAAVVGLNAPRYCLFGDTVNMASRMESTGEPEKIQISQAAKDLLHQEYPEFVVTYRHEMEIKGKGVQKTYFLESKDMDYFRRQS